MKKLITLSVMCLVAIAAVAKEYAQEQPDSIKTQELKEVVVNASYLTREDDLTPPFLQRNSGNMLSAVMICCVI